MQNSKFIKSATIFILLVMLLSLFGCKTSNGPKTNDDSVDSTSKVSASTTQEEKAPEPFGKYEPSITLTAVRDTTATMKFPDGDDISNNIWTREIENTLGIKLNYDWAADVSQYSNKLNVSIASGDIPDFFACDPATYVKLAQNDQLADLSEAYDKYATPELKVTMDDFPEGFNSGKQNGKLVALSQQGFGIISLPPVVWIRNDWMEKFNFSAPETFDDITKMAETFVANKPDGQKDTYGIAIQKDLMGALSSIDGIANAFHAYPTIWIKNESGEIVYGSIQPEMKNALKAMQDWYKKGLISKEFGVKDTSKVNEDLVSGKVGIEFGANWNSIWPLNDLVKKNENAIFKPYAIPSSDDKPTLLQAPWPVNTYYVVNKKCEYPEAIIKLANLFNKKMYHGTEEDYAKFIRTPSGSENFNFAPVITFNPMSDYNKHVEIASALKERDPSKVSISFRGSYNNAIGWVENKDVNSYGSYYQLSAEGAYSVLKKFVDEDRILLTELRGAVTPTMAQKNATLAKLELDTFTKIILGSSLDEFDKFSENWKKLGGEEITKEINSIYNNSN